MKMEDLELVKRYRKWGEYARKSQNQRLSAEDRLAEVVNTLNDVERDIKKLQRAARTLHSPVIEKVLEGLNWRLSHVIEHMGQAAALHSMEKARRNASFEYRVK